jgi:hypothetical protein
VSDPKSIDQALLLHSSMLSKTARNVESISSQDQVEKDGEE